MTLGTDDAMQQMIRERKIYEEVVNVIVDMVYTEFGTNQVSRIRVYTLISENFDGLARSLQKTGQPTLIEIIATEPEESEDGTC